MSFIRPEALKVLKQWGVPGALAVGGGAAIWRGWGMMSDGAWVGGVLIGIGVFACLALVGAVERALTGWRGRRGGPGMVVVEEGRISYFGPAGGGIVALDALVAIDIVTTDQGPLAEDLFWVLTDEFGKMVSIPGGARDASLLLDALGALKNFNHRAVFSAMSSIENARFEIWRRAAAPSLA